MAESLSLLLVDPLNNDRGHPVDDDLFLAQCLGPLSEKLVVATSPDSARNVALKCGAETLTIAPFCEQSRFPRLRLLRLALTLPTKQFGHVVFQSFEELSALVFMATHPRIRVHLIVTSNLRPDRLRRMPAIGRWLLRSVLTRAASVIVHCQREVERVQTLVPEIEPGRVFVKPFHQLGWDRRRLTWDQKCRDQKPLALFLGPECPHKRLGPMLELIRQDERRQFRYLLCGLDSLSADDRRYLERRGEVELHFGHASNDRYYQWFSEAALVVMTHDTDYEGALSGAFCDAVASGTAVVAQDMAPHNEFFSRFGAFGFLVDFADSQWSRVVLDVDLANLYGSFQAKMVQLRAACGLEANQNVFRSALAAA